MQSTMQRMPGGQSSTGPAGERFDVVVIGGGQAGLATGYFLRQHQIEFVILDAATRIGDAWRHRWDSLRTFTPARYDGLPGVPFPAPGHVHPSKDQVADYLEMYAERMRLPVRNGVRVDTVFREGDQFIVVIGDRRYEAAQVVVAAGAYHHPNVPDFASRLDPAIRQFHSRDFRNPSQLQPGAVLVVGAANSGAEIAYDVAASHETWLAGRATGKAPFDIDGYAERVTVRAVWFVMTHILTVDTPVGRKARPAVRLHGGPLERVRPADLAEAGVNRVYSRVTGVRNGLPLLDDGRVLDVTNVVWCAGFRPDFSWIDEPVIGEDGWPLQERGVVAAAPGLYFVGLPFMYSFISPLIGGVGRDAEHVVRNIARFAETRRPMTA